MFQTRILQLELVNLISVTKVYRIITYILLVYSLALCITMFVDQLFFFALCPLACFVIQLVVVFFSYKYRVNLMLVISFPWCRSSFTHSLVLIGCSVVAMAVYPIVGFTQSLSIRSYIFVLVLLHILYVILAVGRLRWPWVQIFQFGILCFTKRDIKRIPRQGALLSFFVNIREKFHFHDGKGKSCHN